MKNDTIILLVMKHRYLSMVQIIIHNAFLHVNRRTETNFECISDWNFSTTSANNIGGRTSNLPNISMQRNRMGPFLPWYKHSLYSLTQLNATKNVPEKKWNFNKTQSTVFAWLHWSVSKHFTYFHKDRKIWLIEAYRIMMVRLWPILVFTHKIKDSSRFYCCLFYPYCFLVSTPMVVNRLNW